MNEVQEKIEEHDAEDDGVSRAPELRQLSENIDKATNTWVNATPQQEVSSFSAWLSSCYLIAITTGRSNLMLTYPSVIEPNLPNMACRIHSGKV